MTAKLQLLLVTWLLVALQVLAQRKDGQYWPCNPMRNKTCDPNPGLNQYSYFMDFTNPPDDLEDDWSTSNFATITYNTKGKNGAEFTFAKRYDAPQLFTNFYIFFGRVDVEMQVAPGIGIISSSVLMSDSFDEVDWEMSGNNFNLTSQYPTGVVQNNYFSKGIVGNYDRGMWVPLANPQTTFYTYSVDWTPERLNWLVNDKVVRTFNAKDADTTTHQYPQTPAKIQFGLWDGGDPEQNEGTKRWSGGITDFSKAPFTMFVRSVRITNYNPAMYYNWTNQSGNMKSIKPLNITLPDPTTAEPTTTATTLEPLRTDLPLSPNGHCGSAAGTICKGSLFGDCCSFYNYCGNTTEYCGLGCQSAFGICGPMNPIATTGVSSAPSKPTSSSSASSSTASSITASSSTALSTTSSSTVKEASSPSQSSVSTAPTTIIISLSRPSTGQSTGPSTGPYTGVSMGPTSQGSEASTTDQSTPTSSSTSTPPPTDPPATEGPDESPRPDIPTSPSPSSTPASTSTSTSKPAIPILTPTSTKSPAPSIPVDTSATSKAPIPPVNEKPVESTAKDLPPSYVASPPPAYPTDTKKLESSTPRESSPTSKALSSPISTDNQSPKPTTTQATSSTAKTSVPTTAPTTTKTPAPTTTSAPTTTTATATTAKTTAPTTAPTTTTPKATTQGPTPSPTTAKTTAPTTTQLNYVATTLPAKPATSTASPKPAPRQLCFWWGRWYCWLYKRAYPVEAREFRGVGGLD